MSPGTVPVPWGQSWTCLNVSEGGTGAGAPVGGGPGSCTGWGGETVVVNKYIFFENVQRVYRERWLGINLSHIKIHSSRTSWRVLKYSLYVHWGFLKVTGFRLFLIKETLLPDKNDLETYKCVKFVWLFCKKSDKFQKCKCTWLWCDITHVHKYVITSISQSHDVIR